MKKQHRNESGISELNHTTQLQNLENALQKSLDDCSVALQSIAGLEKLATETNQSNIGNIHDAQEFLRDAIAYLAIFASQGQGSARIKEILYKYGLEDWF
jgi:hypothetical protein